MCLNHSLLALLSTPSNSLVLLGTLLSTNCHTCALTIHQHDLFHRYIDIFNNLVKGLAMVRSFCARVAYRKNSAVFFATRNLASFSSLTVSPHASQTETTELVEEFFQVVSYM